MNFCIKFNWNFYNKKMLNLICYYLSENYLSSIVRFYISYEDLKIRNHNFIFYF